MTKKEGSATHRRLPKVLLFAGQSFGFRHQQSVITASDHGRTIIIGFDTRNQLTFPSDYYLSLYQFGFFHSAAYHSFIQPFSMKILITGAGGFVGQLLAEHLLNDGHQLVLVDIFTPPVPASTSPNANVTALKVDLHENPAAALSPDLDAIYIFHGIMSAGSEADFALGYRVNLHSTLRLLEAVRQTCPGVRVIYSSSTANFGQPLPALPSEATVCTPQSSYGTQKVMVEMALNDYHRRGFVNAFALRFPTISVRPGKPTQAASSWMSGIIREPLQGKESLLPCGDEFEAWLCSPRTLVRNLKIALDLPRDCMPPHVRQVNLPGITASVGEMLRALREVGGEEAVRLVKREEPSREIAEMLASWPVRFDVSKALGMGFVADQDFKGAVEDFAASLKK